MSDASFKLLIENTIPIIGALAAAVAMVLGAYNRGDLKKVDKKAENIQGSVNGKMTDLIQASVAAAVLEVERVAEVKIQTLKAELTAQAVASRADAQAVQTAQAVRDVQTFRQDEHKGS